MKGVGQGTMRRGTRVGGQDGLRITNYGLRITDYGLRVTGYGGALPLVVILKKLAPPLLPKPHSD
ncbi:hypothetical protein BH23GEM8_BH23GEM8_06850 [soil metagenome]